MNRLDNLFSSRWFHLISVAIITVAVVIIYSNTFNSSFHFDDFHAILDNSKLKRLSNFWSILANEQRPVSMVTFALNYAVSGKNVFGYHITNTAIHIMAAVLAYFLIYKTLASFKTDSGWARRIAFFTALIFAVHPIQTQAVTYVVQRMESLSGMLYLLGFVCFAFAVTSESALKRWVLYAGVPISYLLAFYSKEITITFPMMLVIYDIYFVDKDSVAGGMRNRVVLYGALAALFVIFMIKTVAPLGGFHDLNFKSGEQAKATQSEQGEEFSKKGPGFSFVKSAHAAEPVSDGRAKVLDPPTSGFGIESISPKQYLYTQFNVITYYIGLLAVPWTQNLDYDFPLSTNLFEKPQVTKETYFNTPLPAPVVSLVVIVAILALASFLFIYGRRERRVRPLMVSYFIFWFFVLLTPTSSVVPILDLIFEHRLYLASLGFFTTLVLFID